jgi:hypothetical protein
MNTFPRYFAFGSNYTPGEDYVRCDHPDRTILVVPGVGESSANEELSLPRCLEFVRQGVLVETTRVVIDRRPDRRMAAGK